MDMKKRNLLRSDLPPEYSLGPELEYQQDPALEYTPAPPEYGQHTEPPAESGKKKRGLRYYLSIPAVALAAFLCWGPLADAAAPAPEPDEPPETVEVIATEPAIPDLPEGSVVLDLPYAGRDADTVLYRYYVYTPYPSLDATQEQIDAYHGTPWPVTVYPWVTDSDGRTVEGDPVVWDEEWSQSDYELYAPGLGSDLVLTLRAVYEEDGEERQTIARYEVPDLPPMPELGATLELLPDGDVSFVATLKPQPGDDHDYQLQTWYMGQYAYGWEEEERMGLSLLNEFRSVPVEGDSEHGYTIRYTGGSANGFLPDGTPFSIYVGLRDDTTGYVYNIESNTVLSHVEVEEPAYPLGDGRIVITVYNDTTTFETTIYEGMEGPFLDEDGYRILLARDEIDEADFTDYTLPAAYTPEGFEFAGWVVHVGNPFDNGGDTASLRGYNGDPPVDVLITEDSFAFPLNWQLTREDVEKIPPSEDGNRYVNIHAVWIKPDPDGSLILMDGEGGMTAYESEIPMASEGFLYLCNYPTPLPPAEGMEFDGWYDLAGNRVNLLVGFFSFYPMVYDEDGNFAGYDWRTESDVILISHWK